jgi:hypothetical protein
MQAPKTLLKEVVTDFLRTWDLCWGSDMDPANFPRLVLPGPGGHLDSLAGLSLLFLLVDPADLGRRFRMGVSPLLLQWGCGVAG